MAPDYLCSGWEGRIQRFFELLPQTEEFTACCAEHDDKPASLVAHVELAVCWFHDAGWWSLPIGVVAVLALIGPPGMIYRHRQRKRRES